MKQPQFVRHGASAPAYPPSDLLLSQAAFVDEGRKRVGNVKGREILSLNVFYQRNFKGLSIVQVQNMYGNVLKAHHARRTPASLACHNLISPGRRFPNEKGLHNAMFSDGFGKGLQRIRVHSAPRLLWIRNKISKTDASGGLLQFSSLRLGKKRFQPLS
jgi:hypothetical protein